MYALMHMYAIERWIVKQDFKSDQMLAFDNFNILRETKFWKLVFVENFSAKESG